MRGAEFDEGSQVEFIPWDDFIPGFIDVWDQGQAVTVVGPNGQGKTVLAHEILKARAEFRARPGHPEDVQIVELATKPKDPELRAMGWPVIKEWPPKYGQNQVILWPPFGDIRTVRQRQRAVFEPALRQIFKEGHRTVYFDEVSYLEHELRMEKLTSMMLKQGRSMKLTIVGGTQRPVRVNREWFSEPWWLFLFRTADEAELKRMSEIGGADTRLIQSEVRRLQPHEFLAIRTRTGDMVRSKVERALDKGGNSSRRDR